jgi:hypothetical protein
MNVLVACEFSGVVREAFRARGHNAFSCDLIEAEDASPYHIQGDVLDVIDAGWDLMIAHPPCTHHVTSGARWFYETPKHPKPGVFYGAARFKARDRDRKFVQKLLNAPIKRIALENPASTLGDVLGPPTQIIQPWFFGDKAIKTTWLWLKGLESLTPTRIVQPPKDPVQRRKWQEAWNATPGPDRWKIRSRTYQGIANAMADQWG